MRFYPVRPRLARSLVALVVSASLLMATCALVVASSSRSNSARFNRSAIAQSQAKPSQVELQLTSANANANAAGVTINWTTNPTLDNLGFNVYRITNGQRTRVNREIIPGALFASARPDLMRGGYSYSWFDSAGTVIPLRLESVCWRQLRLHTTIAHTE